MLLHFIPNKLSKQLTEHHFKNHKFLLNLTQFSGTYVDKFMCPLLYNYQSAKYYYEYLLLVTIQATSTHCMYRTSQKWILFQALHCLPLWDVWLLLYIIFLRETEYLYLFIIYL